MSTEPLPLTPLEQAADALAEQDTPAAQDRAAEREADTVIADVDEYVARTDPAHLPEAEAQLEAWQIPSVPPVAAEGDPLVAVHSVGSEGEASIVRGLLEAEGIPVLVQDTASAVYGGAFDKYEGRWADLLVPASEADRARAAIAAAQTSVEENLS